VTIASINPPELLPVLTSEKLHHPYELPPYQSHSSVDLLSWMLKVHSDIWSQLQEDPISIEHLDNQSDPQWTLNPMVYSATLTNYVPNSINLWLCVLQYSQWPPPCRSFMVRWNPLIKTEVRTNSIASRLHEGSSSDQNDLQGGGHVSTGEHIVRD